MKNGKLQCKDIPDLPILKFLNKSPEICHNWCFEDKYNVKNAMPEGINDKLVIKKMVMMIRRNVVDGCPCGCRGDYRITRKGITELNEYEER